MNVIAIMQMSAADSGHAPSGVEYEPRDQMRLAIPLVEKLIEAAKRCEDLLTELETGGAENPELEELRIALAGVQA